MLPAPKGSDNFRHSGISTPTRMISNDVPKSDVWASVLRRLTTCSISTPTQPWLWTSWDAGSALLVEVHLDFDRVDLPHARMIDLGAEVGLRWLAASPLPFFSVPSLLTLSIFSPQHSLSLLWHFAVPLCFPIFHWLHIYIIAVPLCSALVVYLPLLFSASHSYSLLCFFLSRRFIASQI